MRRDLELPVLLTPWQKVFLNKHLGNLPGEAGIREPELTGIPGNTARFSPEKGDRGFSHEFCT